MTPSLTLVANCLAWPGLVDLSWLTLTQECGFHEFATSVFVEGQSVRPAVWRATTA